MERALSEWGYAGLFLAAFLEQIGAPIPAFPLLIAVGVAVAAGHLNFGLCLLIAVVGAFVADWFWYVLGRKKGAGILNFICKISWKPDTCISTTTSLFGRYGVKTLIFAKFIPGLSTIAPPLAGIAAVSWKRFLWFNGLGCVIWAVIPLGIGMYFQGAIPSTAALTEWVRSYFLYVLLLALLGFLLWRFFKRWLYRRDLMKELGSGISVEELKSQMEENPAIFVLDIRHPMEVEHRPMSIPGARHIGHHELEKRLSEIPLERPIVVYCDCPHEEGSVAMVKLLRKHGAKSVRPLVGGLRGWQSRGFETGKF